MKSIASTFLIIGLLALSNLGKAQVASCGELMQNRHRFDFWLGEWDVYAYGSEKLVGKSHIMSINDSTGILENYHTPDSSYIGKSLNTFNAKSGNWEQYWIDNSGLVLKLEGTYQDGKMVLIGFEGTRGNKISWQKVDEGVRQTWETTTDGGASWNPAFDGLYKKR